MTVWIAILLSLGPGQDAGGAQFTDESGFLRLRGGVWSCCGLASRPRRPARHPARS
jgi:hypothetical protein